MSFLAKSSYNYSPHFKVLMLGYYACGKTSLLSRFSQKMFEPEYHMTLSILFSKKVQVTPLVWCRSKAIYR